MKTTIPTRIAGLVVIVALAAGACSSGDTSTDGPVFDPTPLTTTPTTSAAITPTSTITEPVPETTPAPPAAAIELVAISVDTIGVASVVPRGWAEAPEGVFTGINAETGEFAQLGFASIPSWGTPDPNEIGFEQLEPQRFAGRRWDLYALDAGDAAIIWATTPIGDMTYLMELVAPPDLLDHYVDSVGTPALEAFEVDTSGLTTAVIESASVVIDGRTIAYAAGGSGTPTVVFESGHGGGMADWVQAAPSVAQVASIFAYDRPGYGGSDPTETSRDGATMVAELRQLLLATGHEPPYLLVGWSLGGTVMDLYARTHPDEVSGLVLVDSRHHEYTARCLAELGERGMCVPPEEMIASGPPHERDEWYAFELTEQQLKEAPGLDQQVGLVVIAAGLPDADQPAESWELWQATQREYADLVTGSSLVIVDDSDHQIPGRKPAVIIDAIAELLREEG